MSIPTAESGRRRRVVPGGRALAIFLGSAAVLLGSAGAPGGKQVDGYPLVGFERLADFEFKAPGYDAGVPDPKAVEAGNTQIPAPIQALHETKVAVTGFMLPVKMDGGLVKEFLLVKDPMLCCYGVMPKVNEWVVVKMTGKGVQPLMDVPITFVGKLRVGQMFENGYLTGIYLLEGERLAEVKG